MNNAEKAEKPRHNEHEHSLFYFGRCAFRVKKAFHFFFPVVSSVESLRNLIFSAALSEGNFVVVVVAVFHIRSN